MMDSTHLSHGHVSRSRRRMSTPTDGYSRRLGSSVGSNMYCIFWSGARSIGTLSGGSGSKSRGMDRESTQDL